MIGEMHYGEDTPLRSERLRSGSGALWREHVDDIQRARIVSAMVEMAAEHGYLGAAIGPIAARARVSRRTFYELFESREGCFLAAFDWGLEQMRDAMSQAYGSQRSWRERIRYALAALLRLLDAEHELADVCVIEALGAGKLVLERRGEALARVTAALTRDAPTARGASGAPLLTAEGVIGGAFSVIHGRLLEQRLQARARARASSWGIAIADRHVGPGTPGPLIELHGQLMALIVLPYLGPIAAGEELTRSAPARPLSEAPVRVEPRR